MSWWLRNNLRLIQTNLRETDAGMDVERLIGDLQDFGANALMMNAGGIFAFYPTELEYHYRTPYLRHDVLGEAIRRAHEAGMRFFARFDFSKAHESIYARHPEWFYRTREGREVNYNGIVHTCVNGGYQQDYSLRILEEVLTRYPVDGIFFNMFGYQTRDYSGNEYGICHCASCRTRFMAEYGHELPASRTDGGAAGAAYRAFQWATTRDMLARIRAHVKALRPDVAISTYNEYGVDIVRKESNTALARPHPLWLYSASENVQSVEDSWADKTISNCCINAVDLQHRFMGVSPHEVRLRLYESIASGSGLDFCIIGVFADYPDRAGLDAVREVYRFHRRHERYFGQLRSAARLALIKPSGPRAAGAAEYHGLYKMLKEAHLPFDVIVQHTLADHAAPLRERCAALIVPDLPVLQPEEAQTLLELQRAGVHLVLTGGSLTDPAHAEALRELLDAAYDGPMTDTDAAYLLTAETAAAQAPPLDGAQMSTAGRSDGAQTSAAGGSDGVWPPRPREPEATAGTRSQAAAADRESREPGELVPVRPASAAPVAGSGDLAQP
ncbi:family 10 glycosylhydrolase, partial [Paenibacillus sp. IB182496]